MKKTEDRPHALALTHEKIMSSGAGQVGATAQGNHPGTPVIAHESNWSGESQKALSF
jgi:hypothetical protein